MPRSGWGVGSLALLATLCGSALLLRARALQPQREVEHQGLRLRLERAVWLHEATDHGAAAALPRLPGAPPAGQRRLTVELSVFNPRESPLDFAPREVRLTTTGPDIGWSASTTPPPSFSLRPEERRFVTLAFDVPRTPVTLNLEWVHDTERTALLSTRRPPSPEPERAGWPERVEQLPPGSAARGSALFHGRLACVSCHGDPETGEAPPLGPPLGAFAREGATRLEDMGAQQYAYESLLTPNAFITPECARQRPCARPSAMPLYGEVLSAQEMADVIRYLVSPRTGE
jgi:mono/diheme cytochrome c family protein